MFTSIKKKSQPLGAILSMNEVQKLTGNHVILQEHFAVFNLYRVFAMKNQVTNHENDVSVGSFICTLPTNRIFSIMSY